MTSSDVAYRCTRCDGPARLMTTVRQVGGRSSLATPMRTRPAIVAAMTSRPERNSSSEGCDGPPRMSRDPFVSIDQISPFAIRLLKESSSRSSPHQCHAPTFHRKAAIEVVIARRNVLGIEQPGDPALAPL